MTYLIKFKIYVFYVLLSGCVIYCSQGQDIDIGVFHNLSDAYQRWLQINSIPEAARLLQYPPYLYHSNEYAYDPLNLTDIVTEDRFGNSSILDGKCSDDIIQILSNLNSQWALQMLDSTGKVASGIFRGEVIWLGEYNECKNVYAPLDEDSHGDFHGQYCISSWSLNLGKKYLKLPLTVGLCVPDSCSAENLKTAVKNSSHILDIVPFLKKLKSHLTLDSIVCKEKEKSLDAASIIYLTVVSVFILLTILGSCITLVDYWKLNTEENKELSRDIVQAQNYGTLVAPNSCINDTIDPEGQPLKHPSEAACDKEITGDKIEFTPNPDTEYRPVILHSQQSVPAVKRILLCFSLFTNGKKILDTKSVDGQLLSIHGIRFLSLTWVILGHTYITSVNMIGNKLDALKDIDTFAFQMLLQAPFSVDSFFLLSGFLVTYLFLKQVSKKNGKVSWLYFYIHRIWRLTPSYIMALFFFMLIFKHLGSGPFWNDDNCDANRDSWWMYVLYVNNFIPIHQMCLGWSWYLANDMQFYVISPLILYPLWKWPKAGFAVIASFLVATWTTTAVMSYSYDLIPMFVGVTQMKDFTAYETRMWDSFDLIYDKPYCRIAPYIIGVILGYILHRTADRKNFLNWWQQLIGWLVAAFCSLSVVFGLYHVEMSKTEAMFYNTFCRSSFAVGLAWLIYVCETGHGGFLTKFLSWKLWIPVSRLTYCAYLVHPMLIHGYYRSYQEAFHFTQLVAVTNFMGFLLMSYGLAFIFSLVFESPFMNLEKLIIKRKTA